MLLYLVVMLAQFFILHCMQMMHVQLLCSILPDCHRFEAAAEERHQLVEQAAVMERNKLAECQVQVEERAQHRKLLEMLHDGKISEEIYHLMKPNGF